MKKIKNKKVNDDIIDMAPDNKGTYDVAVIDNKEDSSIVSLPSRQRVTIPHNRKLEAAIQVLDGFAVGLGVFERMLRIMRGEKL